MSSRSVSSVHTARIVRGQLVIDYPEAGRPYQFFNHESTKSGLCVYPIQTDETVQGVAQYEDCKMKFGKGAMLGKMGKFDYVINYDNKVPGPGAYQSNDKLIKKNQP